MKSSNLFSIFAFGLLGAVFSFPAAAQTVKIRVNSSASNALECKTRINRVDSTFEVLVPDTFKPTSISSRRVTLGTEGEYTVFSFEYTPETDLVSCAPTQTGLDIQFLPVRTGTSPPSSADPVRSSSNTSPDNGQTRYVPISDSPALPGRDEDDKQSPSTDPSIRVATNAAAPPQNLAETTAKKNTEARKEAADLSVPESPGFTILGLTPQSVIRPATPREFATSLINSLDDNGNFQTGVAIDTAPYLLFFGKSVVLGNDSTGYRAKTVSGYLTRLASRTQFSLATTKGTTSDDKSARIGAGLHVTLFDRGDPRLDAALDACFNQIIGVIRGQAAREVPDYMDNTAAFDRYEARLESLIETNRSEYKGCIEESKKRNFTRSSLMIGGAGSWISENGDSGALKTNGSGIWASLAYGFEGIPGLEENSQLIFHFRRRVREKLPDSSNEGVFTTKDTNLFGVRLRFGVPNWTGNLEALYQGEHFAGKAPDNNFRLSFGTDYRVAPNLYLNFSVGGETKKSSISERKVFVRTSFNWGASTKSLGDN